MQFSNFFYGQNGQGSFSWQINDPIVNPNHAHRLDVSMTMRPNWDHGGIDVSITLGTDNERTGLFTKSFTHDDLMNAYENCHHRVHGYDARGLDPREGRTRLKP